MTIQNCYRLLEGFEKIIDGRTPQPPEHRDWGDVILNAKTRARLMKEHIAKLEARGFKLPVEVKEPVTKLKEKSDGKKST